MELSTVSKALAGAAATAVASYATKHGIVLDQGFTGALSIVLAGLFGFVVVYLSPKNKSSK